MSCFKIFDPTASAVAYGWRPQFGRAEHSATAEGENLAYGPTLFSCFHRKNIKKEKGVDDFM